VVCVRQCLGLEAMEKLKPVFEGSEERVILGKLVRLNG
jgi:hypothetical protein